MKARLLLLPLSALAALAALALWLGLESRPAHAPSGPTSNDADTIAPGASRAAQPPADAAATGQFAQAAPPAPPPAPQLDANPGGGKLWFRLLDADTNQPLAQANCELWYLTLSADSDTRFSGRAPKGGHWRTRHTSVKFRSTDARGLLSIQFSSPDQATTPGSDPADSTAGIEEPEYAWLEYDTGVRLLIPVPAGWHPYLSVPKLRKTLMEAAETPVRYPLDLHFHRPAELSCRVCNSQGRPIVGAAVYAFAAQAPSDLHTWAMFQSEAYFVTQKYSGMDNASLPVPATAPAIEEAVRPLRDQLENPWNFTDDNAPAVVVPALWSGLPPSRSIRLAGTTDSEGKLKLGGLHSGLWVVCAWSFSQALTCTSVVVHRAGEVTLTLGPERFGGVRVILEWSDSTTQPGEVVIRCHPAPDLGSWVNRSRDGHIRLQPAANSSPLLCQIGGLARGQWLFDIADQDGTHIHRCSVDAGKTSELRVQIGADAFGLWKPYIRFGGRIVQGGRLYLTRSAFSRPDVVDLNWPDDNTEPEPLELPAGEYMAWVPGTPGLMFTIEAGQTRTDIFDVPVASAGFSIDQALADLLDGSWDDSNGVRVRLDLYGLAPFDDAKFFAHMGEVLHQQDQDYDMLAPGKTTNWWLPPGTYRWVLNGYFDGTLTVGPGQNSFHFSLQSLPGLARLDVTIEDAGPEDTGVLHVGHARNYASDVAELGQSLRGRGPSGIPQAHVFSFDHGSRHIVFAQPGTYVAWARTDRRKVQSLVTVPGRVHLKPLDAPFAEGELAVTREPKDSCSYRVLVYSPHLTSSLLRVPGTERLLEGPIRLCVERRDGNNLCNGYLALDLQIQAGEILNVNLTTLTYEAPGWLSIRCKGPGDADATTASWWSLLGPGPQVHRLTALDHAPGGIPTEVMLEAPDELLPEGRLEFAYNRRCIPPGRYRLVPWPGAPERHCRTVKLMPGQHIQVVVDTNP